MPSRQIAISPADAQRQQRLLAGVSEIYGVRFVPSLALDSSGCDAAILFDATRDEALRVARSGLRCQAFIRGPMLPVDGDGRRIAFAESSFVTPAFRGATLRDSAITMRTDLGHDAADEVLARSHADALWVRRHEGRGSADLVGVPAPVLDGSDYLFARFHQDDWFSLLPLLAFAAEVSGWTTGPVRACFMFDDPNLHWRSYGYVKYTELEEHAGLHNYHASFATVPMDGWYVHPPTARLFSEHVDRLSLLIHGNDHTHHELHRPSTRTREVALAAQALRRIERLERVAGVPVARVMAAPHGACSETMANAMLQTGFEAASISRGSLMARNPESQWPIAVGLRPAEFMGGGLPIIPRFNILSDVQTRVRFAAFLGQAVIPVGHHDDLHDGLELMERIAGVVNSIGGSQWMDAGAIARTNYLSRYDKDVLQIRMFSRRIRLRVPTDISRICVERPWLAAGSAETLCLSGSDTWHGYDSYEGTPLVVEPGTHLTISAAPPLMLDPHDAPPLHTGLQAVLRRQLCEGRDRLRPALDRLKRLVNRGAGVDWRTAGQRRADTRRT